METRCESVIDELSRNCFVSTAIVVDSSYVDVIMKSFVKQLVIVASWIVLKDAVVIEDDVIESRVDLNISIVDVPDIAVAFNV